ncbi:CRP-like cAMP-binding protein [Bradyrhizobium sp. USDA 3686]|nr:CRP-like cAMP-binding protein [Bradyrhizobium canariense]
MAVSVPDLRAFLLATPFFGGIPDQSLDLLMSMLVECRFDTGATVVTEGEPGRSLFIVKSGRLAVSKRANAGNVIPISVLEPGDFFGEMTLIEMQNRSATVVAESPTVRADRPEALRLLQGRYPHLCDRPAKHQSRAMPTAAPFRRSVSGASGG